MSNKILESFKADFESGHADETCATTFEQLLEYAAAMEDIRKSERTVLIHKSYHESIMSIAYKEIEDLKRDLRQARNFASDWIDDAIAQADARGFDTCKCYPDGIVFPWEE